MRIDLIPAELVHDAGKTILMPGSHLGARLVSLRTQRLRRFRNRRYRMFLAAHGDARSDAARRGYLRSIQASANPVSPDRYERWDASCHAHRARGRRA